MRGLVNPMDLNWDVAGLAKDKEAERASFSVQLSQAEMTVVGGDALADQSQLPVA